MQVYIVEECIGSRKLVMRFGLKRMLKSGASLISFEMIFFELIRDPQSLKLSRKFIK